MNDSKSLSPRLLEMGYHDTYYFAQVVNRTLTESLNFLGTLDEFFGDLQFVKFLDPFPKWSALHKYVWFAIEVIEFEQLPPGLDPARIDGQVSRILTSERLLGIERTLDAYGFDFVPFRAWATDVGLDLVSATEDDILEYYHFLDEDLDPDGEGVRSTPGPRVRLHKQICEEVFFLTFMNRALLLEFNRQVAEYIAEVSLDDVPDDQRALLARDGVLRRQAIPTWVRRAVFHRDRGRCTLCGADLSGTLSLQSAENYDHVVPLAKGGINDVTNIQLLCRDCNAKKSDGATTTRNHVERWHT